MHTLKEASANAAKLTKEKMAAAAYTEKGRLVKGYKSQEEARRHRVTVKVGVKIYLPDGSSVTATEGLQDIESAGWHYAYFGVAE